MTQFIRFWCREKKTLPLGSFQASETLRMTFRNCRVGVLNCRFLLTPFTTWLFFTWTLRSSEDWEKFSRIIWSRLNTQWRWLVLETKFNYKSTRSTTDKGWTGTTRSWSSCHRITENTMPVSEEWRANWGLEWSIFTLMTSSTSKTTTDSNTSFLLITFAKSPFPSREISLKECAAARKLLCLCLNEACLCIRAYRAALVASRR